MQSNTQKRIVELRNELRAQKVASGLTYSQLLMPDNTPSLSYSGTASWTSSTTGPVARVRFRFERTDGLIDPPLINFAHDSSYSPTYKEYAESNGFVFSGGNLSYLTDGKIEVYIGEVGDGYVDFYVDYANSLKTTLAYLSSITISTTCTAIANVKGTLSVERII